MRKANMLKWGGFTLLAVLVTIGTIFLINGKKNDASKIVLADEALENSITLHNAMGEHACDCFQPWISNVTISNITSTSFDVTWDCGTYTGGAGPATYQVTYGTTTAKSSIYPETRPTVTYTNHTVTVPNLTPNTKYNVGVKSYCLSNCSRGGGPNVPKTFQQSPHADNWEVTTKGSTATYTVSGTISTAAGAVADVIVTLSGAASKKDTTNANGAYSFAGLEPGTYTVTPRKTGMVFDPPTKTYTLSANQTAQNYTGKAETSVARQAIKASIMEAQAATITAKDVTITWKTNIPATSMVEYGLTTDYGMKSGLSTEMKYTHSMQLFQLQMGKEYHARVVSYADDNPGSVSYSDDITFKMPALEERIADRKFIVNEPNPASTWTMFTYNLYQPAKSVTIDIMTLSGKKVATLESPSSSLAEGWNKVRWDNINLKNGLYVYRMKFRTVTNMEEVIQCSSLRIQR